MIETIENILNAAPWIYLLALTAVFMFAIWYFSREKWPVCPKCGNKQLEIVKVAKSQTEYKCSKCKNHVIVWK